MKRSELAFTLALVPLDYLALLAAGIAAFYARFLPAFTRVRPVIFDMTLERYVAILVPIAFVWLAVFSLAGLYSTHPRRIASELSRILLACSSAMAAVFAILFFSRVLFESRFIAVAAWAFAVVFVSMGRIAIRMLQRAMLSYGIGTRRIVVIGDGKTSKAEVLQLAADRGQRIALLEAELKALRQGGVVAAPAAKPGRPARKARPAAPCVMWTPPWNVSKSM